MSKTLFPELVQKSKSTGVLIPITAYTVLESEAQEKVLKQKEKQKLKNNASLELVEAYEPPIWFLLIVFFVFTQLTYQNKKPDYGTKV